MLLGVDHLQFSVPCLEHANDFLRGIGFGQQFVETGFDQGEPVFFRERGKSMAFHSSLNDTRIELINAAAGGPMGYRHDTYVPVFSPHAELVHVGPLAAVCRGPVSGKLIHVEVHVDHPVASEVFWRRLGFQPDAGSNDRLRFPATMAGMGLAIELRKRGSTALAGPFVDDPGCSLIALIDRDPDATLRELDGLASLWTSHPFRINGRPMRIHLLRGPSGELVELIHFAPHSGRHQE